MGTAFLARRASDEALPAMLALPAALAPSPSRAHGATTGLETSLSSKPLKREPSAMITIGTIFDPVGVPVPPLHDEQPSDGATPPCRPTPVVLAADSDRGAAQIAGPSGIDSCAGAADLAAAESAGGGAPLRKLAIGTVRSSKASATLGASATADGAVLAASHSEPLERGALGANVFMGTTALALGAQGGCGLLSALTLLPPCVASRPVPRITRPGCSVRRCVGASASTWPSGCRCGDTGDAAPEAAVT
mmetsp:Transcript_41544/g.120318  ORF Transcript_41544/g.120318 Transcript_41544/m.120318 type:complete len:249 (-) Transcript_41544:273-1019(-)